MGGIVGSARIATSQRARRASLIALVPPAGQSRIQWSAVSDEALHNGHCSKKALSTGVIFLFFDRFRPCQCLSNMTRIEEAR